MLVLRSATILPCGSRHRGQEGVHLYSRPPTSSKVWRSRSREQSVGVQVLQFAQEFMEFEEFRQWVRARIFDNSVPLSNQILGRWKINNGSVAFYFELVEVRQHGPSPGDDDRARHEWKPQDAGRSQRQPRSSWVLHYLLDFVGKFVSSKVTGRKAFGEASLRSGQRLD